MSNHSWNVVVTFTETDRATRADAVMDVAGHHLHGWGQARRDPVDDDIPVVGEEIAAARALIRLAHRMLGAAEQDIEAIEQHPVRIHA